ncbi:unnamed protein product [Nesidiocoris tenuis]|uniref:Uncharacterized protein n=1 Tax=Nesidiocoris tenuis TaxID=355587 RepID=A0A6H5GC70_9HEMI|nr:unnamed protein product [Nesidiocoris tenuis]
MGNSEVETGDRRALVEGSANGNRVAKMIIRGIGILEMDECYDSAECGQLGRNRKGAVRAGCEGSSPFGRLALFSENVGKTMIETKFMVPVPLKMNFNKGCVDNTQYLHTCATGSSLENDPGVAINVTGCESRAKVDDFWANLVLAVRVPRIMKTRCLVNTRLESCLYQESMLTWPKSCGGTKKVELTHTAHPVFVSEVLHQFIGEIVDSALAVIPCNPNTAGAKEYAKESSLIKKLTLYPRLQPCAYTRSNVFRNYSFSLGSAVSLARRPILSCIRIVLTGIRKSSFKPPRLFSLLSQREQQLNSKCTPLPTVPPSTSASLTMESNRNSASGGCEIFRNCEGGCSNEWVLPRIMSKLQELCEGMSQNAQFAFLSEFSVPSLSPFLCLRPYRSKMQYNAWLGQDIIQRTQGANDIKRNLLCHQSHSEVPTVSSQSEFRLFSPKITKQEIEC